MDSSSSSSSSPAHSPRPVRPSKQHHPSAASSASSSSPSSFPSSSVRVDASPSSPRFPYCVVWGPLPLITWFLPFIGHMGIADSAGRIHDFAGPYTIGVDDFMTGKPAKYVRMMEREGGGAGGAGGEEAVEGSEGERGEDHMGYRLSPSSSSFSPSPSPHQWDEAISQSDQCFAAQMHNICLNNCHHHTARALDLMGYRQYNSQFKVWWLIMTRGKYVGGMTGVLRTYLPFLFIVTGIILLSLFA